MNAQSPQSSFDLSATCRTPDGHALLAALRHAGEEHGLQMSGDAQALSCDTGYGRMAAQGAERGLELHLNAADEGMLQVMRDMVLHFLQHHAEGLTIDELSWSDDATRAVGVHPRNFHLLEVAEARRLSRDYIRIRLKGTGLAPLAETGLHFRLCLPRPGRVPVWPIVGADARTVWPEGPDALHTPAYTIIALDIEAGWLEFDVYTHGNGPTCHWAEGLVAGTEARRTIGLTGPGGGWLAPTADLIMAGDETALPAMVRSLDAAAYGDAPLILLELADPEAADCLPARHIDRFTLLLRSRGESAAAALAEAAAARGPATHIWFAGETSDAQRLRKLVRSDWAVPRGQHYVAGYWTRSPADT
ncbi:siderophore-interacting protein [Maritimibacter alkaliphilus]|uniref:siderophore-interacting protein n=1 Tax=Maritimibacter alkaliphilus TaxID=404236 RepID=UPI001C97EEC6|nr:siderophore-interacting protein [Maritimibacter alkaliphilus]MBY6091625.1 siderophore-interacting protein [Maritimibacter alkaliphilus]